MRFRGRSSGTSCPRIGRKISESGFLPVGLRPNGWKLSWQFGQPPGPPGNTTRYDENLAERKMKAQHFTLSERAGAAGKRLRMEGPRLRGCATVSDFGRHLGLRTNFANLTMASSNGQLPAREAQSPAVRYDALERRAFLHRFRRQHQNRAQRPVAAVPDLLAANFRFHLSQGLFRSGCARSYPGFFRYGA